MNDYCKIFIIAVGCYFGRLLWYWHTEIQNWFRSEMLDRAHAKALKKAETDLTVALAKRVKARILKVGRIRMQQVSMPFGLPGPTTLELNGWEFEPIDDQLCPPHSHLPDGRCLFRGHTAAELVDIHRKAGAPESDAPWQDGDGDAWKHQ